MITVKTKYFQIANKSLKMLRYNFIRNFILKIY